MELATYAEKYTNKLRRLLKPLFVEKEEILSTERFAIHLTTRTISAVHINKTAQTLTLISQETLNYDDAESVSLLLSGLISRSHLENVPICWLLTPEDYQLFLIESLPVEKGEFYEALKWRARSLISFPVEEAVIDAFKLPPKKGAINSMIAAVIAKRMKLAEMIVLLQKAEAKLKIIDIPELAMRNLTALYENDEKSSAFVYFYGNTVILNISREKNLFFTRHIPVPFKALGNEIDFEGLCLDLLRYFDYYQSQWRHPSPTRVMVASHEKDNQMLALKLSEYMMLSVLPYQIRDLEAKREDIVAIEKNALLTFGLAIRESANDAKTGN